MKTRFKTKSIIYVVIPTLLAAAFAIFASGTAHAAYGFCNESYKKPSPFDDGGKDAYASIGDSECDFTPALEAYFHAYDERLDIDWILAAEPYGVVEVEVYNFSNQRIDVDKFTSEGEKHLGTPDGSGDIKEGYKVRIRQCADYSGYPCSKWAWGTA